MPEPEEEKPAVPAGIKPVFLSTATQQIFKCVADSDVTSEVPHIMLKKDDLLKDIQNRAAVSDFQPLKQIIQNYPEEELLLVYDYEFKYEQNFYLCITEEAKELVLNPPVEEGEGGKGEGEEEDEPIPTTPEPREWVCLGTDKDIEEAMTRLTRPLFKFTVSKKRKYFEMPILFSDYSSSHRDNYIDIPPTDGEGEVELRRLELDSGTQAVPETSDTGCQTIWRDPVNVCLQYGTRELSEEERHSHWTSDAMANFLTQTTPRMEKYLQQNEIFDILPDDYVELADDDGIVASTTDTNLKEYQSFTDLRFSKDKILTCIDWHPTIKGIVGVSCGQPYSFDERIELSFKLVHANSLVLIWSFGDPIHPQLFLEAPEDILCFKFNPSNPNLIAGGCINGQVVVWDITEYQDRLQVNRTLKEDDTKGMTANMAIFDTDPKLDHAPIVHYSALSSIEHGHTQPVCDLVWVPDHIEVCHKTMKPLNNTNNNFTSQLITCGLDGYVMFWDLRPLPTRHQTTTRVTESDSPFHYLDLAWKPFYKIPLARSGNPGNHSLTHLTMAEVSEIRKKTAPAATDDGSEGATLPHQLHIADGTLCDHASTLLSVGSEEGEVVYVNWLPVKDPETGKPTAPRPLKVFSGHAGLVSTVQRSPFFPHIILTVGGWNFSIWKEGLDEPLLKSGNSSITLTGGAWSPTRPGVFFISKHNGNIDVWDMIDRSHVPSLAQNVSSLPITYLNLWSLSSRQLMIAAGDSGGTLHILEVPWSLSHSSANELSAMEMFFEREVERLEFVEKRGVTREAQKKTLLAQQEAAAAEEEGAEQESSWETQASKDYEEYLSLEKTLLITLGVIEPPSED